MQKGVIRQIIRTKTQYINKYNFNRLMNELD